MKNKKVVTFGEVMLRLSTPGFARLIQAPSLNVTYAGAEANVAASLVQFGIPAAHVTRFPNNDLGFAAVEALRKVGVDTSHILYGDERMGVYFLENGVMQRASRIIYDRFESAFMYIKKGAVDWDTVLKDAAWFHYTGITPAISQGAADVCLEALKVARKKGLTVSGDINYRRNLWRYGKSAGDIMPGLVELTDILVAGSSDMESSMGIKSDSFEDACRQAFRKFPNLKKIAKTNRDSMSSSHNKVSGKMFNGKKVLRSQTYDLTDIVDRVGAGDAFMAGLIFGWVSERDDQATLEFATAASAWKHSIEGDVNRATVAEIDALVKGENVGKLLR